MTKLAKTEPWASETVSKPHFILIKAGRGARLCAHKPRFINDF